MSLLTSIKKGAASVAGKVSSTPLTQAIGNTINRARGVEVVQKTKPLSVAKAAGKVGFDIGTTLIGLPAKGVGLSVKYGPKTLNLAKNLATKLATPAKAAVTTATKPGTLVLPSVTSRYTANTLNLSKPATTATKPGTVVTTKAPTPSKPTTTASTTKPKTTIETKTTNARNTGKIDTSTKPTVAPTATRKLPVGKIATYGGLGLAGASLLGGGETPVGDNITQTPTFGSNPTEINTGTQSPYEDLSPDVVFGSNNEQKTGFETTDSGNFSNFATTPTESASATTATIGGYTGIGGGGANTGAGSVTGGGTKTARQVALERLLSKYDESTKDGETTKDEQATEKRIADIEALKQNLDIDLETSAASAYGRGAQRTLLDRETRRSLIPLQTSLALFQAERERQEAAKDKDFEREKYLFEQQFPQETADSLPSTVQEYTFAVNNGYQGSYQDFLTQVKRNETTTANDRVLTPTEASALGVPYGTTQSQAYGAQPTKLSGDASKILAITQTIVPEINALKSRFQNDYRGTLIGFLTGTDRELVKLVDQVADKVGRLRSGGAVNKDEEARFKKQIASLLDLPFGDSEQAIAALDGLINEAQIVSSSINPYETQVSNNSGFTNW